MSNTLLVNPDRVLNQLFMIQGCITSHLRAKHGNPVETQIALTALSRYFELMNQGFISDVIEQSGKEISREDLYKECRVLAEEMAQGLYKEGQSKNE
jgi:hypothetical protein